MGPHVAKAIWGKTKKLELSWQDAYVFGSQNYEENEVAKKDLEKKQDALIKEYFEFYRL